MTLDEALYYIHSVCWKGSIPGLTRINALLDKMGHPERKLKFIHVTGTNGKGSTCAMLASIFTKAGYKTGLYTSPYLIRFNERIQIDGVQISDEDICQITEYIKPLADSIFEQPTEFEMVTALGFEYFARQGCDLVVCEVGMGGEFDATNVILPPEAAVICNIGLDHTEVLGDTLEKIAATKSGIIKPGCDAVIYREKPSVEAVIEARVAQADVGPVVVQPLDLLQVQPGVPLLTLQGGHHGGKGGLAGEGGQGRGGAVHDVRPGLGGHHVEKAIDQSSVVGPHRPRAVLAIISAAISRACSTE